jgi:MFS family permease
VRFFLGFIEAAYYPGCLYYLSCWYKRDELSLRTTILYMGAHISGAFSGLIAAGVTSGMDGARGWRAWRWLFLIEGTVTVAVAFLAFIVLPNLPRTTRWLTEEERAMAIWRLQVDIGADDWRDSKSQMGWEGLKQALADPKTYMLLVVVFSIVSAGSITNFFPIVVKTLHFDNVKTLLLTSPPYVMTAVLSLLNSWHSDRTGDRFWHIVLPFSVGIVAFILGAATTSVAGRYTSIMLMVSGLFTNLCHLSINRRFSNHFMFPLIAPRRLQRLHGLPRVDIVDHAPTCGEADRSSGVYQCVFEPGADLRQLSVPGSDAAAVSGGVYTQCIDARGSDFGGHSTSVYVSEAESEVGEGGVCGGGGE